MSDEETHRDSAFAGYGGGIDVSTGHRSSESRQGYFFAAPTTNDASITAGFGGDAFAYKGLGLGAELAYANHDNGRGVGSANVFSHFLQSARYKVELFVTGGFSLYFGDGLGPGFNFGGGVSLWMAERAALRLEVRDHVPNYDMSIGNHYFSFASA